MVEKVALLLGQARGAYQREHYEVALGCFEQACAIDPHSPEALLGTGEVAAQLGRNGQAIDAFIRLADIYTSAGMLEVAADVVGRVLEIDPRHPIARRVQGLIRGRVHRATQPLPSSPEDGPTDIFDKQHPIGPTLPFTGQDEASFVTRAESIVSNFSQRPSPLESEEPITPVVLSELEPWSKGDGDDEHSEINSSVIVNRELDSILGQLDIDTANPSQALNVEAAALDAEVSAPFADTVLANMSGTSKPHRLSTEVDTLLDAPEENPFDDISTRAAPDGLMQQLAQAASDPFSAETVAGDVPLLLKELRDSSVSTAVAPSNDTPNARGSGRHELSSWDLDTTAAVMAENIRVKPQLRLEASWNENDFPLYEEDQALGPPMVTGTIALDGEGPVVALASLMGVSPLVSQLDMDGCEALVKGAEVTQCFAGQVVINEGEEGSSLFLLASGKAAVERQGKIEHARRLASISPGAFFGEASLLADAPREASVRLLEDSLLLELDRETVQALIARNPRVLTVLTRFLRARLLSALMMDSPLFHQLPLEERTELAPRIHLHKLNPGQPVARSGQVLTGFCTVMAGELRRFDTDIASGTGTETLSNLGPGSSFGSGSLSGTPSPFSIAAATGCWLLRLPSDELKDLVDRHPELLSALIASEAT